MSAARKHSNGRLGRNTPWTMLGIASLSLLALAALLILRTQSRGADVGVHPSSANSVTMGSFGSPVLGVVVDRNLRVVDLEAGGAAEKAGIRKGDMITKINATSVASSNDSKRIVRQMNSGQAVTITLTRGGQELTLSVLPAGRQGGPGLPTPTAVPTDLDYF